MSDDAVKYGLMLDCADMKERADKAESRVAELEAERDEARGELERVRDALARARIDEMSGASLREERDRLAATVAAVREHCMDGTFDSCDDDHQIGQNDALEAVLKVLDSPVSAVRVTVDAVGPISGEFTHDNDDLMPGKYLLVKVK
jgi:septal ring factor EnvC (AmiA/AmiB activator)